MSESSEAAPVTEASASQPDSSPKPAISAPVVAIALLVVAVGSAFAGEWIIRNFERFYYPPDHNQLGDPPEYIEAVKRSMMANMAIGYGLFGTLLLGLQGLVLGAARKGVYPLAGLLLGAVVGLVCGAATAPVGYLIQHTYQQVDMEPTIKTAMILGLTFAAFGIGGGLIPVLVGLSRGMGKAVVTGIGVAVFALVVHLVVATAAFPINPPEMMFSVGYGIRVTALVMMALGSAITAMLVLRNEPAKE